ncbi:MAG: DUF2088 domain-containing protein [Spirochaetia bacterium]|nr:DUF2088 domain-containing protein [Spirochaetia bacterium]
MEKFFRDSSWDRDGVIEGILQDISIPKMAKVRQLFDETKVEDIPLAIETEFNKKEISSSIIKDASIAITVGSRGIANLALIVREVVKNVKRLGAHPFIIPAMGSHGGATAAGQLEVLHGMGVTEEYIDAPIKSSMDTTHIGVNVDGQPVLIDSFAAASDGIILLGRVKPHTAFRGTYESGLYKMMAIGLGKQKGAEVCHVDGFGRMGHNVITFGEAILEKAPILFGIALIENAFDDTAIIEAIHRDKITSREPELLEKARTLMPQIAISDIDILIVDQIGKNFSGDGMDPNITATYCTPYASGGPIVQRYVVLDLSDETHGNAMGAGMADIGTKRLFDKIDFDAAYPNALTCTVLMGAKIPVILKNDKNAIQAAIFTSVDIDKKNPRIVRIANTSHISTIIVSEALKQEVLEDDGLELLEEFTEVEFDEKGNLDL